VFLNTRRKIQKTLTLTEPHDDVRVTVQHGRKSTLLMVSAGETAREPPTFVWFLPAFRFKYLAQAELESPKLL
jgi:hypothetical protein